MALDRILLGMLTNPSSGYDLKKEFSQKQRHFWSADLAQIYPALAKLEKKGWLTSERIAPEKGPAKKIFQRTKLGTVKLVEWISSEPELGTDRIPYLGQLFFLGGVRKKDHVERHFNQLAAKFKQRLAELAMVHESWADEIDNFPDSLDDSDFYKYLTLTSGMAVWQARLDWCENSLRKIQSR